MAHEWITPQDLARALADLAGLDYVDLAESELEEDAAMLLSKDLAARYQALPMRYLSSDMLLVAVAVADPTNVGVADDLRLALGHNVG